jgi:hypothetical protein
MPLKVNSLFTNSIVLNGAELTNTIPSLIGKINYDNPYIIVSSAETILDTFVIPANTFGGISYLPQYSINLDCENGTYDDLIIRMYVTDTETINPFFAFHQETFSNTNSPVIYGDFVSAANTSPSISNVSVLDFVADKIYVLSDDGNLNIKFSVNVYENFDVSKDLYITVTAEKLGTTLGVKSLAVKIIQSSNE